MDYRNYGRSAYNDLDSIRTKGFDPVGGVTTSPPSPTKLPTTVAQNVVNVVKEVQKEVEKEVEVKKAADIAKEVQKDVKKEAEPDMYKTEKVVEKVVEKVAEVVKPTVSVTPNPPPVVQSSSTTKPAETTAIKGKIEGQEGAVIEKEGKNFSQLKELYEKKIEQVQLSKANSRSDAPVTTTKPSANSLEALIHQRRSAVVEGLFSEFETKNIEVIRMLISGLPNCYGIHCGYSLKQQDRLLELRVLRNQEPQDEESLLRTLRRCLYRR